MIYHALPQVASVLHTPAECCWYFGTTPKQLIAKHPEYLATSPLFCCWHVRGHRVLVWRNTPTTHRHSREVQVLPAPMVRSNWVLFRVVLIFRLLLKITVSRITLSDSEFLPPVYWCTHRINTKQNNPTNPTSAFLPPLTITFRRDGG
jgi:hypothetical protein